jgi:hypothetical protein
MGMDIMASYLAFAGISGGESIAVSCDACLEDIGSYPEGFYFTRLPPF